MLTQNKLLMPIYAGFKATAIKILQSLYNTMSICSYVPFSIIYIYSTYNILVLIKSYLIITIISLICVFFQIKQMVSLQSR